MYESEILDRTPALSEEEKKRVRSQVQRLLETPLFRNSRRYPALLRFLVEETLEGRGEYLKERLIGIRVFDRSPDYDTAADPTVRVTIAEVRKRIAQYYHDERHDSELRIELLPGRYVPEFRLRKELLPEPVAESPDHLIEAPVEEPTPIVFASALAPDAVSSLPGTLRTWRLPIGVAVALLTLLASAYTWLRPSPLDALWGPILNSHQAVLICLPTGAGRKQGSASVEDPVPVLPPVDTSAGATAPQSPTFFEHQALGENVVYSDMLAALDIGKVLAARHRDYRVRLNLSTTLEDLRHGPTVLVGGLDNQWTMHTLQPLRFHFAGSDSQGYWIADTTDPGNHAWSLDLRQHYTSVTRDYAIVARLHSEQTGQPEMIVAGIGMSGTAAAGEFLADERRMQELRRRIGAGFAQRDFELVLSTEVVNGIAGAPKIEAVWVPDQAAK